MNLDKKIGIIILTAGIVCLFIIIAKIRGLYMLSEDLFTLIADYKEYAKAFYDVGVTGIIGVTCFYVGIKFIS